MFRKEALLHFPVAAGQPLETVSKEELQGNRRIVEGRPQDFGSSSPLIFQGLPPDYDQATGPYHTVTGTR